MNKQLLLALLAAGAGSAYAADLNYAPDSWNLTGTATDVADSGNSLTVPSSMGGEASCSVTVPAGKYTVTWTASKNAVVKVNGVAATLGEGGSCTLEDVEPVNGQISFNITSEDGINGYSISDINISISFDFQAAYDELVPDPEDLTEALKATVTITANATDEVKAEYAALWEATDAAGVLAALAEIQAAETADNETAVEVYQKYDLYNGIATMAARIEAAKEAVANYNLQLALQNVVSDAAYNLAAQETILTDAEDADAAKENPLLTSDDAAALVTAAKEAIATANKAIEGVTIEPVSEEVTEGIQTDLDSLLEEATAAVSAVTAYVANYEAYDTIWGEEEGLVNKLAQAVEKVRNDASLGVYLPIQAEINDKATKIQEEALANVQIAEDKSNITKANSLLAGDVTTLNDAIAAIEDLMSQYNDSFNASIQSCQDNLDEATAAGGDEYADCRPSLVDVLKAQAETIQGHINALIADVNASPSAEEVEAEIALYKAAVEAAVADKTTYEENIAKYFGATGAESLNYQLSAATTELKEAEPANKAYKVVSKFSGTAQAIQDGINALESKYTALYNSTAPLTDTDLTSYSGDFVDQIDAYKSLVGEVVGWVNELDTLDQQSNALYSAVNIQIKNYKEYNPENLYLTEVDNNLNTIKKAIDNIGSGLALVGDDTTKEDQQLYDAIKEIYTNCDKNIVTELISLLDNATIQVLSDNQTYMADGLAALNVSDFSAIDDYTTLSTYYTTLHVNLSVAIPALGTVTVPSLEDVTEGSTLTADVSASVTAALKDRDELNAKFNAYNIQLNSLNDAVDALQSSKDNCDETTANILEADLQTTLDSNKSVIEGSAADYAEGNKSVEVYVAYTDGLQEEYDAIVDEAANSWKKVTVKEVAATATSPALLETGTVVSLDADFEALKSLIENELANINTNETNYKTIRTASQTVNNDGAQKIATLLAIDPDDETGVAAEIQTELDKLYAVNNDNWAAYANLYSNADNTTVEDPAVVKALTTRISAIESAINNLFNNISEKINAVNAELYQEWLSDYVKPMEQAFGDATTAYNSYNDVKNAGLKAAINTAASGIDMENYYSNIYDQFQAIADLKAEVNTAYNELNPDETLTNVLTKAKDKAEDIISELEGLAELRDIVISTSENYYEAKLAAANASLEAAKTTLEGYGISEPTEDTAELAELLDIYLKTAYYAVVSGPEQNISAVEGDYDKAVEADNLTSVIDSILGLLDPIAEGIDLNDPIAKVWDKAYASLYTDVISSLYEEFLSYNPDKAEIADWSDAVNGVNTINTIVQGQITDKTIAANFNSDIQTLINAVQGLRDQITDLQKAQEASEDNQEAYDNWNNTIVPSLNDSLDTLKTYITGLAGAADANLYDKLEGIQKAIEEQTSKVETDYNNGSLSVEDTIEGYENDIIVLINGAYTAATAGEKSYLTDAAKYKVDEAFSRYTVAYSPDYVWPDGQSSIEKFPNNFTDGEPFMSSSDLEKLYTEIQDFFQEIKDYEGDIDAFTTQDEEGNDVLDVVAYNLSLAPQFKAYEEAIAQYLVEWGVAYNYNPVDAAISILEGSANNVANLLDNALVDKEPQTVEKYQETIDAYKAQLEGIEGACGIISDANNYVGDVVILGVPNFEYIFGQLSTAIQKTQASIDSDNEIYAFNNQQEAAFEESIANIQALLDEAMTMAENYASMEDGLPVSDNFTDYYVNYKGKLEEISENITNAINKANGIPSEDEEEAPALTKLSESRINEFTSQLNSQELNAYWLQASIAKDEADQQRTNTNKLIWNLFNVIYSSNNIVDVDQLRNDFWTLYNECGNLSTVPTVTVGSVNADNIDAKLNGVYNEEGELINKGYNNLIEEYITSLKKFQAFQVLVNESEYLVGDLNRDGRITVSDYVKLISIVLMSKDEQQDLPFIMKQIANVNGDQDGRINVADLTALLNLIKTQDLSKAALIAKKDGGENNIRLVDMGTTAQGRLVGVEIINATNFAGAQFDIVLGDLQIVSESVSERAKGLDLYTADYSNGIHRMVIASQEGNAISGTSGVVATFEVVGEGSISVIDGVGADIYGNGYDLTNVGGELSGIENISIDSAVDGEIFNLQGQKLNRLQQGVNIIRKADGSTRKVMAK